MSKEYWRTYTQEQAVQVKSALQLLLDREVLDKKEQEAAKKIQRKLSYRAVGQGEDKTLIDFNAEEEDLLAQVEVVLWK